MEPTLPSMSTHMLDTMSDDIHALVKETVTKAIEETMHDVRAQLHQEIQQLSRSTLSSSIKALSQNVSKEFMNAGGSSVGASVISSVASGAIQNLSPTQLASQALSGLQRGLKNV